MSSTTTEHLSEPAADSFPVDQLLDWLSDHCRLLIDLLIHWLVVWSINCFIFSFVSSRRRRFSQRADGRNDWLTQKNSWWFISKVTTDCCAVSALMFYKVIRTDFSCDWQVQNTWPTYSRRVHVSAEPAGRLRRREAVDELVGRTGLVLGDVLQVDGLLQQDLPLDPSPVVSLNRIDHLTHGNTGRHIELNTSFMNNNNCSEILD